MTIPELLDASPDGVAVVFGSHRVSYDELRRQSHAVAAALGRAGVGEGDRVLLLMPNMPAWLACWFGILRCGAVAVPVPVTASDTEIDTIAAEVQPAGMISIRMFYPVVLRMRTYTDLKAVMMVHIREYLKVFKQALFPLLSDRMGAAASPATRDPEVLWFQQVVREGGKVAVPVSDEALASVVYTSGATDRPKGVMLSHRNLVSNALQLKEWAGARGAGSILAALPLSQLYAVTGCIHLGALLGATLVLLPTFDMNDVMDAMKAHHPTLFPGVPSMYMRLAEHRGIRGAAVSGLRACISGGAPLPVEVQEAFERLTRSRLVEGYGLIECGPVTHASPLDGHKTGTIGRVLPQTEARIVGLESREPLPVGEVGELEVRGPQVMMGYYHAPELTERAFHDGWLRTGDLAVCDTEGYYQIVCRTQDLIEVGDGRVIYPRDVEEVLYEHPQVLDVAVVGLARSVKACVVPRHGESIRTGDLIEFCRHRLPAWKVPSAIEVRGSLPRTADGKILYRVLQNELSREAFVMGDQI
ncbi:MAG TPA: AMP-binding protein [Candidatus Xenobia bacterium]